MRQLPSVPQMSSGGSGSVQATTAVGRLPGRNVSQGTNSVATRTDDQASSLLAAYSAPRLSAIGRTAQLKRDGAAVELCMVGFLRRTPVHSLTEWPERLSGKDGFDGQVEELADAEHEFEARIEIAALDVADGLVVDAERIGQSLTRETAF